MTPISYHRVLVQTALMLGMIVVTFCLALAGIFFSIDGQVGLSVLLGALFLIVMCLTISFIVWWIIKPERRS